MNSDPSADGPVIGRYVILREIGHGAMATVHLAHQIDLDRTVALKQLTRIGAGESPVFATRFLREARLAGSLSHANIVTVYEYFEYERRPYIAMEYVEGGSLRGYLGGLSLFQVVGVLEGLLAALTHAEARGIAHRDLKPENILVTTEGRIKIADFGIAKAYSAIGGTRLTATGAAVGTPMYMAPEQATGKPLSIATDLYAVGIVAFEMLFGYVPFGSTDSPLTVLWQHVNERIPDSRALRPDLDPRLCGWLERLLAKEPADRPPTAAAALDALEEIALALLGNRWRRESPLPMSSATIASAPRPTVPPRRSQPSIDGCGAAPAAGSSAGGSTGPAADDLTRAGATGEAAGSAIAPVARDDQTQPSGWARRDRPVDDLPPPAATLPWSARLVALVVAATILAAGGGYLAFHRDDPPSRPIAPMTGAGERFTNELADVWERLSQSRKRGRARMGSVTTARDRAAQARRIAASYRTAAAAVDRLTPAAEQRADARTLRDELLAVGEAYDGLAEAGSARREKDYDAKRETVEAEEARLERVHGMIGVVGTSGG